ncbi:ISAs1 family transposase [bacterium]|nr:ISAs1 family transposase [bacterium]
MVLLNQKYKVKKQDKSLFLLLHNMTDFRRNEGKIHDLEIIIMIILMAIMSGHTNYTAFYDFTHKRKNKRLIFKYLKPRKKVLPSYDTIRRVFLNINFDELAYVFKIWALQHIQLNENDWISFDGKAIKGTLPEESHKLIQLITFFVHKSKTVLLHGKIKHKSNEIPLVQQLIKESKLENLVLTGDAMHTQKKTINLILEKNNSYVLCVKNNQKTLLKKVKFLADKAKCPISKDISKEKNRGRFETRKVEVFKNDFLLDLEELGFKQCKYIIKVNRNVKTKKNESDEQIRALTEFQESFFKSEIIDYKGCKT